MIKKIINNKHTKDVLLTAGVLGVNMFLLTPDITLCMYNGEEEAVNTTNTVPNNDVQKKNSVFYAYNPSRFKNLNNYPVKNYTFWENDYNILKCSDVQITAYFDTPKNTLFLHAQTLNEQHNTRVRQVTYQNFLKPGELHTHQEMYNYLQNKAKTLKFDEISDAEKKVGLGAATFTETRNKFGIETPQEIQAKKAALERRQLIPRIEILPELIYDVPDVFEKNDIAEVIGGRLKKDSLLANNIAIVDDVKAANQDELKKPLYEPVRITVQNNQVLKVEPVTFTTERARIIDKEFGVLNPNSNSNSVVSTMDQNINAIDVEETLNFPKTPTTTFFQNNTSSPSSSYKGSSGDGEMMQMKKLEEKSTILEKRKAFLTNEKIRITQESFQVLESIAEAKESFLARREKLIQNQLQNANKMQSALETRKDVPNLDDSDEFLKELQKEFPKVPVHVPINRESLIVNDVNNHGYAQVLSDIQENNQTIILEHEAYAEQVKAKEIKNPVEAIVIPGLEENISVSEPLRSIRPFPRATTNQADAQAIAEVLQRADDLSSEEIRDSLRQIVANNENIRNDSYIADEEAKKRITIARELDEALKTTLQDSISSACTNIKESVKDTVKATIAYVDQIKKYLKYGIILGIGVVILISPVTPILLNAFGFVIKNTAKLSAKVVTVFTKYMTKNISNRISDVSKSLATTIKEDPIKFTKIPNPFSSGSFELPKITQNIIDIFKSYFKK